MSKEIKTIVVGAGGRMGAALIREIAATDGVTLFGATEQDGHDFVGRDAGDIAGLDAPLGVEVTTDPLPLFADADALIDFTVPVATLAHAELAAQARIVHVIGTTGFTAEDEAKIEAAARHAIIVKAGNMSLGVNVLTALTRRLAKLLNDDFDIEIVEMHHRHKVDAPSGTALMLGEAAAEGRGVSLAQMADRGRDGITGERERGRIGLSALRGGNVVGEHTVMFAADNERIELSHIAGDRSIFARGAVAAVKWGMGVGQEKEARQKPGLYSMLDVLGLDD